jgi:hypothetical protein
MSTGGLSDDDQVSLLIGRAARQAVELELALQRAFKDLADADYQTPGPTGVDNLIDKCLAAIPDSRLPSHLHPLAAQALEFARSSNRRRNRLVHDLWRDGGNGVYLATKFDGGDPDPRIPSLIVADFGASVDDVRTAAERVKGIYFYLMNLRIISQLGGTLGDRPGAGEAMLEQNVELMAGRFKLSDEGVEFTEWKPGAS